MILPDVNVLIYAFRRDAAEHRKYRQWLDGVVNAQTAFGMSPQILASVIRIATNPAVYRQPSTVREAVAFADIVLQQPNCRPIRPGIDHWSIYTDLLKATNASGNLSQDAWLAAMAIEHGCELVSADRDFGMFPGLRWRRL